MRLFFLIVFLVSLYANGSEICNVENEKAESDMAIIESDQSGYEVIGLGRVYFYSSPNNACKDSSVFIIPGDRVNAYGDYKDFTYVMYFSKRGKEYHGWVKSERLHPTGTGIGPAKGN
ncbi:hypothetical protein [Enterobacter asburiae]|uniref:hypothetical protein n=1 Tax=Enterobacter asburiae TaxID=61645 RepID=UPI003BD38D4B